MNSSRILELLERAKLELGCERCGNRGWITIGDERDECPECRGDKRNTATIELLDALADHATGYIRKVLRG